MRRSTTAAEAAPERADANGSDRAASTRPERADANGSDRAASTRPERQAGRSHPESEEQSAGAGPAHGRLADDDS
jgi:hypothetical protein